MSENSATLENACDWLKAILNDRLRVYLGQKETFDVKPFSFYGEHSRLYKLITRYDSGLEEFALLMLALIPNLKPDFFDQLIAEHLPEGGEFPEFGGVKGVNHRGLLPTGETAQFIIAGDDIEKRIEVQRLLGSDHWFAREHILWLEPMREGEPVMSGRLIMNPEIVELLTVGTVSKPRFSMDFPAEHIETEMDWDDLVLPDSTIRQIHEIESWITHNDTLLHEWGMKKKIKPGYKALFYGPPGTGKTLTATLLGKQTGKDVFRIDLSRVISKYIGETEKNLSRLFDKAENKEWILFFDEADALFGKRTDIRDAHDKYANQEVAYLLQRIENYNGLVILATNQRGNIDPAFARRFQSIVSFPMPRMEERLAIWEKTVPIQLELDKNLDLRTVAERYELSGAAILNVVHYCAIEMLANTSNVLDAELLDTAVQREYLKEGRIT